MHLIAVNVAVNAKKCACLHSFSSWFVAGALAHVNVEKATAINEAVIKGDLQTAKELFRVVRQGRLSGSPDPLALKY